MAAALHWILVAWCGAKHWRHPYWGQWAPGRAHQPLFVCSVHQGFTSQGFMQWGLSSSAMTGSFHWVVCLIQFFPIHGFHVVQHPLITYFDPYNKTRSFNSLSRMQLRGLPQNRTSSGRASWSPCLRGTVDSLHINPLRCQSNSPHLVSFWCMDTFSRMNKRQLPQQNKGHRWRTCCQCKSECRT